MRTKIRLHGLLATKFGQEFEFVNLNKPTDFLSAMSTKYSNFLDEIKTQHFNGMDYEMVVNDELINDTDIPDSKSLIDILSIRNKTLKNDIKNDKLEEIENMENTSIEEERKKLTMMIVTQNAQNNSVKTADDINIVKEFLNILSQKRCESYDD